MNELIKVTTNEQGEHLISGRDLHEKLNINEKYTQWIKRMIDKCRLLVNTHYTELSEKSENYVTTRLDHILILDAAKHICMVQNSELGFIFRDYFIECEKKLKQVNKIPQSYSQALMAAAIQAERAEKAELERDYAIQTKAEINNKKTATAMNTASQLSKENQKLKEEIGANKKFATVKKIEKLKKKKFWWKPLRDYSNNHELEIKKIADVNFGFVNAYSAKAWEDCYGIILEELFN